MADETASLYSRLGGYDAIAAVADRLVSYLQADEQLGRFWQNRGLDGVQREKQLLIDFLCSNAGGPLLYTGRNMQTTHRGMAITEGDWSRMIDCLNRTLSEFNVPETESSEVLGFVESTKSEVVDP
jgi:hemoglobin